MHLIWVELTMPPSEIIGLKWIFSFFFFNLKYSIELIVLWNVGTIYIRPYKHCTLTFKTHWLTVKKNIEGFESPIKLFQIVWQGSKEQKKLCVVQDLKRFGNKLRNDTIHYSKLSSIIKGLLGVCESEKKRKRSKL